MKDTLLIYSGGMDSTTLLYEYQKQIVLCVSFNYGSKHNEKEIQYAKINCDKLGIDHIVIPLSFINQYFKSDLLKSGNDIPEGHYEEKSMKRTVVPFRNGIMLSIAAGIADSKGINKIYLASHRGDRAQYKDCTEEFTDAINSATVLGTDNCVKVISPYNNLMKWDIVKKGIALKVDYSKTHSCYNAQDPPCSKCGTCVERTESFFRNDIQDPKYPTKQLWEQAVEYMQQTLNSFDGNI